MNTEEWYTASQGAAAMTKRNRRPVKPAYLRSLARLGKITTHKLDEHTTLYLKSEVDAYKVEDRGVKAIRAAKARSKKGQSAKRKEAESVA